MQEMLKITGIRKSFSTLDVLKGVDLTVHKGEVVSLIGPSGSGKTTLLRCANFLDQAEDGTMVLDGQTYHLGHVRRTEMYEARRHTAFVFQNYNLFLNKTALQNVTEGLIVARKMPRDEAEARAQKAAGEEKGQLGYAQLFHKTTPLFQSVTLYHIPLPLKRHGIAQKHRAEGEAPLCAGGCSYLPL